MSTLIADGEVLTVSQINFYIKEMFKENKSLFNVFLMGEVSNLVLYNKSGHTYFSLKDEKSSIKAVIFASVAKNMKFLPQDGLKVIVRGDIGVFETNGTYQIYVSYIEPAGLGALNLAFNQLKTKLEKAGIFNKEHKKDLPLYPKKVGVITSSTGAVLWDIQTTLKRRAPIIEIYFLPVMVQGAKASSEVIEALNFFNKLGGIDTLIIARGGGSIEDLWPFNSEELAYAIFESNIPVISAVGHETDFTICDFASDKRAATPTAAAEIISIGYVNVKEKFNNYFHSINRNLSEKLLTQKYKLEKLKRNFETKNPVNILKEKKHNLELYHNKLFNILEKKLNKTKNRLVELKTKLESFNPQKIFSIGYALVLNNKNRSIKSVENISLNDTLNVKFLDGTAKCDVKEIIEENLI